MQNENIKKLNSNTFVVKCRKNGPLWHVRYNILDVAIDILTDSYHVKKEAEVFWGAHGSNSDKHPDVEITLRRNDQDMNEGEKDASVLDAEQSYTIVEGDAIFLGTGNGHCRIDTLNGKVEGVWETNSANDKDSVRSVSLLHMILVRVMFLHGYIPLHAAAVESSGKLILFVGSNGSGKSVLALLCHEKGLPLVADDLIFAKSTDKGVLAGGYCQPLKIREEDFKPHYSPWLIENNDAPGVKGKMLLDTAAINPGAVNALYPISSIIFLERGDSELHSLEPYSPMDSIINLLESVPMEADAAVRQQAFQTCSSLTDVEFIRARTSRNLESLSDEIAERFSEKVE